MKLKLGDKIYFFTYSNYPNYFETIIKITPKMYKTKNNTLKLDGDYIRIIGKGTCNNITAELETEKIKALWVERQIVGWFDNYKFSVEEKKKIYNLLNKKHENN